MSGSTRHATAEHPPSALGDRTVIRAAHDREHPYFIMRRDTAQDDHLSWEARGLLAYLLSKADDWKIMLGDLRKQGRRGRDATRRILKELETAGYLTRECIKDAHGRFDWLCTIREKPQVGTGQQSNSPCPENPSTVKRATAQRATVNQPIYKEQNVDTKESKKEREKRAHEDVATPHVNTTLTQAEINREPDPRDSLMCRIHREFFPPDDNWRGLSLKAASDINADVRDPAQWRKTLKRLSRNPGTLPRNIGTQIAAYEDDLVKAEAAKARAVPFPAPAPKREMTDEERADRERQLAEIKQRNRPKNLPVRATGVSR